MKSLQGELLDNIQKAYPNSRSLDDLFAISDMLGHKQSLCEWKLRILVHSGLIEVIKDERGYNKAYRELRIEPFKDLAEPEGFYFIKSEVPDCLKGKVKPDLTQSRLFTPRQIID